LGRSDSIPITKDEVPASKGQVMPFRSASLERLYDEHYRSLVKLATMYVDDLGSAEEVVQDAFVRLLTGTYTVTAGKEHAYLRRMVLNGARSKLRKRRVRRLREKAEPEKVISAAEDFGIARSEGDQMLAELRRLPERQSAVLVLRYYLDLSEIEIAETLDIAPGSVKSHAHRGLAKLQKVLNS